MIMPRLLFLSSALIVGLSAVVFPQAQAEKPPVPLDELPSVYTVPKEYQYSARGRRDPFVNPVPKPKTPAVTPLAARPPGLKGVMVSEAQIAGVVTSKEPSMNVVIISAPGARAAYFARVGDELYDAVVKTIKLDTVTFTLTASGADPKAPREIVRRVRPNPGENK
jgi:hypothetical protein